MASVSYLPVAEWVDEGMLRRAAKRKEEVLIRGISEEQAELLRQQLVCESVSRKKSKLPAEAKAAVEAWEAAKVKAFWISQGFSEEVAEHERLVHINRSVARKKSWAERRAREGGIWVGTPSNARIELTPSEYAVYDAATSERLDAWSEARARGAGRARRGAIKAINERRDAAIAAIRAGTPAAAAATAAAAEDPVVDAAPAAAAVAGAGVARKPTRAERSAANKAAHAAAQAAKEAARLAAKAAAGAGRR
jgi:hypothetical protein